MGIELIEGPDEWRLSLSVLVGLAEARELTIAACATVERGHGDVVVSLEGVGCGRHFGDSDPAVPLRRALAAKGRTLRFEMVPPVLTERWRRAGLYNELVFGEDEGGLTGQKGGHRSGA